MFHYLFLELVFVNLLHTVTLRHTPFPLVDAPYHAIFSHVLFSHLLFLSIAPFCVLEKSSKVQA